MNTIMTMVNYHFEGYFLKGNLEGETSFYHDNGQLKEKISFKNGKGEGLFEVYHDNGQLKEKGIYKNLREKVFLKSILTTVN